MLYLAQANNRLAPNGALIQGQDVSLITGGDLHNSGTLRATNNLSMVAGNIDNSGLMQAGNRLEMLATDSIRNTRGGIINARDISATAVTGDILNERTVTTFKQQGEGYQLRNDVASDASPSKPPTPSSSTPGAMCSTSAATSRPVATPA